MNILSSLSLVSTLLLAGAGCAAPAADDDTSDAREAIGSVSAATRAAIMNSLRANVSPSMGGQAIVFDVSQGHFQSDGDWAFLMGNIQLRAGGAPTTRGTAYEELANEGLFDGFRIEALLQRQGDTWTVVEHGVGSTDVWWDGIWRRYAEAPRGIFPGLDAPVVKASERMAIMGALRVVVKGELADQDVLFDVSRGGHFAAKDGWCWLRGRIQLRDGREPTTVGTKYEEDAKEGLFDGFQVQALLKNENGSWRVLEHGIGSTDVWWDGIAAKYPAAPPAIWDATADREP